MILRVRFPDGQTVRVTIDSGEGPDDLYRKILALERVSSPFELFNDVKFSQPFVLSSSRNGDFVFVKGDPIVDVDAMEEDTDAKAENTAGASSAASASGASSSAANGPKFKREECPMRVRHGPNGMCELCMPKEDSKARYEKELAKWEGRGMSLAVMEALEALKVKIKPQEDAHIKSAVVDTAAAQEFQAYLAKTSFSQQRVGICYGSYVEESQETHVNAIYEPPQTGSEDTYQFSGAADEGDISDRATGLATMLGLDCVGIVVSTRERKCILSAKDIVVASRFASKLEPDARKAFVVLLVSVTDSGETAFEAYQLSDQAVEVYERDLFAAEEDQKPNGGRTTMKEDVLVEGKETKKVHTEFFTLNIPIKSKDGTLRVSFPVENRELKPQAPSDVRAVLQANGSEAIGARLRDFHLLLFLSAFFDMKTDMPTLAKAALEGHAEIEEGYRLMIESMAGS